MSPLPVNPFCSRPLDEPAAGEPLLLASENLGRCHGPGGAERRGCEPAADRLDVGEFVGIAAFWKMLPGAM